MSIIVAIDGPSGVGKTTTSRGVAAALSIPHIDTGAMYRAIALSAIRVGVAFSEAVQLRDLASRAKIELKGIGSDARIFLDGEEISNAIRTPEISMAASNVSAVPEVRRVLVRLQQEIGRREGGVLEGRDIGTKVFPETPFKFFLTARAEVRAQRRYRELLEKGDTTPFEEVLADLQKRDAQDSSRADSPLTFDETYTIIDTSEMTLDQVVGSIVARIQRERAAIP